MSKVLNDNPLPYFYYTSKPISETPFDFINKALDMRHIDLRIQLYIKSQSKVNVANQCGTNHLMVRYSKCYESQRQYPVGSNIVEGEILL
jgi:L-ribulose-5-phosphate 3-epimerase UlaE